MTTETNTPSDLIDQLAGLTSGDDLFTLRHQREKVAVATQGSYDSLFDPELKDLGLDERVLVALYACRLSHADELTAHYQSRLATLTVPAEQLNVVLQGNPDTLSNDRLRAILVFTRTLIENPIEGDKAAIETLPKAGLTIPAVVALAQLIAFVSYQIRVVAGLKAMKASDQAAK